MPIPRLADHRIKDPSFLLVYAPLQFEDVADESIRPDSSLALPYLHAALSQQGYECDILDASIGRPGKDKLADTFYRRTPLKHISDDMIRLGMTPERILEEVRDYDVIAVSSIFTQQTSRCFELSESIKTAYPEKILIAGGVNARALREHFFDHGYDVVFLSEGEKPLINFAEFLRFGSPALGDIPSISFRVDGRTVSTRTGFLVRDLDEYPMPSWARLPNEQYWVINEPWGGKEYWLDGKNPRFASILTSRGCPFRCDYCHISKEKDAEAGNIGTLRLHSIERVGSELDMLQDLGVDLIYINDDSFLAKKNRVREILTRLCCRNLTLADVNGVNIIHLFKRQDGKLVVDVELLELLYEAGFRRIGLPFESGSQRLIDRYSSSKWNMNICDVFALVRIMSDMGFVTNGNFMIGYPDETPEELASTFLLASRAMAAGLGACGFFMVQPFPGTVMFDEAMARGQLKEGWHWDRMGFPKDSAFSDLLVDPSVLSYCRTLMVQILNRKAPG